jgi:SAM-dependent methyltransferase
MHATDKPPKPVVQPDLAARSNEPEHMDTDCADFADYARCLRDLSHVNRVTLTARPVLAWLKRETRGMQAFTLLDVACGHGDMLRRVHQWAERNRLDATLEGIDRNPWSAEVARGATPPGVTIRYRTGDVFAFTPQQPFDFIISSQFLHHLDDGEIITFIRWLERHARLGWCIGDLHRHWFPYHGFGLLASVAGWHRFVRLDGRISIARGFTIPELQDLLAEAGLPVSAATLRWHVPFRLCVTRRCPLH